MSETHALTNPPSSGFINELRTLRTHINLVAQHVKDQHVDPALQRGPITEADVEAVEEVHANLTLAFRHLEDAAMRLGKAIQAHGGGQSVYD